MNVRTANTVLFLGALSLSWPAIGRADTEQEVFSALSQSPKEEEINAKLGADLDEPLVFQQKPLKQVVAFVEQRLDGYKIQFDSEAMDRLRLGLDEPVSVEIQKTSLRNALKLVLRKFNLAAVVADDSLIVTTQESANRRFAAAVYPVADLVTSDGEMTKLVAAIKGTVARGHWDGDGEMGGRILPLGLDSLSISHTAAVHKQVQGLLAAFRLSSRHTGGADKPVTLSYLLSAETAKHLDKIKGLIKNVLGPEEHEKTQYVLIGDRLVIQSARRNRLAIDRVMTDSGLVSPSG